MTQRWHPLAEKAMSGTEKLLSSSLNIIHHRSSFSFESVRYKKSEQDRVNLKGRTSRTFIKIKCDFSEQKHSSSTYWKNLSFFHLFFSKFSQFKAMRRSEKRMSPKRTSWLKHFTHCYFNSFTLIQHVFSNL